MKETLWAKKGLITITVVGDSAKGTAPLVTVEIKDPQILFDEGTNTIRIVETK